MNHTYRLVWSNASQRYVPVPECARGRSKSKTAKALTPAALVLGMALGLPLSALAQAGTTIAANTLPTGGSVVQGSASIGQNGNAMAVQQGSDKAIINWSSFHIGKDASVQFIQPQNTSIALNRVIGSDGSQILGQLTANGQVWLVNPNGIVFGQGARVDVGGLVASTLNITDQDFRDGNYRFSRNLQGSGNGAVGGISNQGQITARDGGSIALLAPTVSNDGVLRAQLGTVAMAAGDRVTLSAGAHGLLQVEVDPSTIGTLVENKQLIVADGGQVIMTGKAADALSASVVSNTGTVQARTLQQKEGRILLLADMAHGRAQVAGTLDASAPGGINGDINSGNGGFIETSAAQVQVADGVQVTTRSAQGSTGTWLIDPTDFSVNAGAGAQTVSRIGADTLAANLANNHITLQTAGAGSQAGDLTVDAAVSWSSNNKLTLQAHNDIKLNASITNTGSGSFAASAGRHFSNTGAINLAGGDVTLNGLGRIDVDSAAAVNVGGVFTLESGDWRQLGAALPSFQAKDFRIGSGASFLRVKGGDGSTASPYQISDVYGLQGMGSSSQYLASAWTLVNDIDASATANWNLNGGVAEGFKPIGNSSVTFTGALDGRGFTIKNLRVNTASQDAGLFGRITGSTISDVVLSNASVASQHDQGYAGALAGQAQGSTISGISSSGSVTSYNLAGGLLGFMSEGSRLQRSSSSSNVQATYQKADGNISSQFAHMAGGLVGTMNDAVIEESWASGTVLADGLLAAQAGGLVGGGVMKGSILGSYSTSAVEGKGSNGVKASVGGLAGQVLGGLEIDNSYYQGPTLQAMAANNSNSLGGLVGADERIFLFPDGVNIRNSYADVGTIVSGSAPTVLGGVVGKADSKTSVSGSFWNHFALPSATGNGLGTVDAVSGVKTAAQLRQLSTFTDAGWDIDDLGGTGKAWRIYDGYTTPLLRSFLKPGELTIDLGSSSKTYDQQVGGGTVHSWQYSGAIVGLFSSINPVWSTTGANAGTYQAADGSLKIRGFSSGQQGVDLSYVASYTINKKPVLFSIDGTVTKTYDGTTGLGNASAPHVLESGLLTGDSFSTSNANFAFADKNAGANKTLNFSGITVVDGNGGNNYDVSYVASNNNTITPKSITGTITADSKVYDATAAASTHGRLDGVLGNDDLHIAGTSGSFADKNVGLGKTVTINGITLSGADAGNYLVTYNGMTQADIDRRPITGVITADGKTYDGNVQAVTHGSLNGVLNNDDLHIAGTSGSFTDKNAGTGKAVNVAGVVGGADAGNYEVTFNGTTQADIARLAITGAITADGKTYDATTLASTHGQLSGVLAGDDLTVASTSGQFSDKNAGTGKTVNVSGVVGGADAGNYDVSFNRTAQADIAKLAITGAITAGNKTYDATTQASTQGQLNGVLAGDDLTVASTNGQFSDKNAGTGKTVNVSAVVSGADAGNYEVTFNSTTTANITSALPTTADHAGLSGQILWRETASSPVHEDPRLASSAPLQARAPNALNLTLARGYIRLDE